MPQTVEIPSRGIAEFPDEMSPDEIKGVIQKKFYSPAAFVRQDARASPTRENPADSATMISAEPSVTDAFLHGDIKGAARTALGKVEGYLTRTEPGAEVRNLYDETIPAYHPEIKPGDETTPLPFGGIARPTVRQAKNAVGVLGDIVHGLYNPMNLALMVETGAIGGANVVRPVAAPLLSRLIAGAFAEQTGEGAIRSEVRAASLPPGSAAREQAHFETAGNVVMTGLAGFGAVHPTGLRDVINRIYPKVAPGTEPALPAPARPATEPAAAAEPASPVAAEGQPGAVPVEAAQATVPDLKSTEEAVTHGESGTADVLALHAKRDQLLAQAETVTGDEKVALITQAQLYREAAEAGQANAHKLGLQAIQEENGLQLNRGSDLGGFIVKAGDGYGLTGPDDLLDETAGEHFKTPEEAVKAATDRGLEVDPRVIQEYGNTSAERNVSVPRETAPEGPAPSESSAGSVPNAAKIETGKGRQAADEFATELTPVSSHIINDVGGLMSKSTAKANGLYAKNPDLWDGAPTLSHPTHNKIYASGKVAVLDQNGNPKLDAKGEPITKSVGNGGETPDVAAQSAYDHGLIREPSVDALWEAIAKESKAARTVAKEQRATAAEEAAAGPAREPEGPTGIRNAIVDKQRVDRGLPERMAPLRKTNPEAWDAAMAKMDENPNAGRELISEIKDKPRALKPEESALLAHETVTRENNFDNAVEAVNRAKEPGDLAEAKQRLAAARDDVQELYDAGQKAGTESGQSLQARKILVNQDYSLAKMEAIKRAVANDGQPLSDAQVADVKAAHDKIAELQAKLDEYESAQSQEKQMAIYRQLVKESLTGAKEAAKQGGSLQATLDAAAAKARQRIIDRRGRLNITVDPLNVAGLVDEAIIGASHIARGITKFADWSTQMVKDFGERISPYLKDLWERARQYHDAHAKLFEKGGDEAKTTEEALARISANAAAGKELNQKQVFDLARAHVNAGVEGLDNVMKRITSDLQESHPGITEREVRDTFSGYGETRMPSKEADLAALRDYRRQAQLVSALEDAQAGEAPLKSGQQRDKPSDKVRELQRQVAAAMKEHGIETSSPEEQLASTNQSRATSLRNQITDLEKRLETGEKPVKGQPVPETQEVTDLKVKRDALKEELRQIEGPPERTPLTNEQKLARLKTVLKNKTEDLQKRIAAGDYTKPTRIATELDQQATKLRADYQRAKDEFDRGVETSRLANRSPLEKTLDTFAKWRRAFVLSSPVTLAKLTSAAVERMAFTPMEEAIGAGISKVIPSVAEKASREGGASIKAEAKALTEGFTKGMRDAWDVLRTGKSDLDVLYGKRDIMPREAIDFIGSIHGALKTVTKRNEFARSFQKRVESAIASGIDTSDPLVQTKLAVEAYKDANRSIFLQDNRVVTFYKRGMAALEQPDKITGKVPLSSKVAATGLKVLLPVVKVPTNIVAETMQYSVGAVTGTARLANAFRKGIETLKSEQADLIMRDLKKGSLGAAVMLLGYLNAENVGGYYQPGEKRKEGDVKAANVRIFGHDVPSYLIHNPLLETLQIGATIRRVADSKLRKKDTDPQGLGSGVMAAAFGLTREVPFAREMFEDLPKLFDAKKRGQFVGEFTKSLVIPQAVQWLAKYKDQVNGETVKRDPKTLLEHIETGIPGLRETVPTKKEKHR